LVEKEIQEKSIIKLHEYTILAKKTLSIRDAVQQL